MGELRMTQLEFRCCFCGTEWEEGSQVCPNPHCLSREGETVGKLMAQSWFNQFEWTGGELSWSSDDWTETVSLVVGWGTLFLQRKRAAPLKD